MAKKKKKAKKAPKPKALRYSHMVETINHMGKSVAKFTNPKHAKAFVKRQKEVGLNVTVYEISPSGKLKPVKK